MRFIKRTRFNVWLQPSRVGRMITKASHSYKSKCKFGRRSPMQMHRRAQQGSFNVRYNRYIALIVRVRFYIKPDKPFKVSPSFMRKRL